MNDETSTSAISADARATLASVLDEIIPTSTDGKFPGAGQLGLAAYVETALRQTPAVREMVAQGLSELDEQARRRNAAGFAALPRADKQQLLNQQAFVLPLTLHVYIGYYQNPRVASALGLEPRPPHPKGYEMEPNDLTLLDAVRRRRKLYREG